MRTYRQMHSGVVHTERQHLYIHYTNNTYMYLQEVRGGERERRERERERKKEKERERGKERVSV
jgi:hypothetical protein